MRQSEGLQNHKNIFRLNICFLQIGFVLRHKADQYNCIAKHIHNPLRKTREEIMSANSERHCQLRLNQADQIQDLERFTKHFSLT